MSNTDDTQALEDTLRDLQSEKERMLNKIRAIVWESKTLSDRDKATVICEAEEGLDDAFFGHIEPVERELEELGWRKAVAQTRADLMYLRDRQK